MREGKRKMAEGSGEAERHASAAVGVLCFLLHALPERCRAGALPDARVEKPSRQRRRGRRRYHHLIRLRAGRGITTATHERVRRGEEGEDEQQQRNEANLKDAREGEGERAWRGGQERRRVRERKKKEKKRRRRTGATTRNPKEHSR